jgi:phosphatidylinositol alpha-1,6-mannosyltransferase
MPAASHFVQNEIKPISSIDGESNSFLSTLVLSEHFLPACGGTITWLLQTYSRYKPTEVIVIAAEHPDARLVDSTAPFKVERIPMKMADWDPTRLASLRCYINMFRRVRESCRRNQSQQIHCLKVLPEGLVAWGMHRFCGVPYLLYAHGEEIQMRLTSRKLSWLIPPLYKGAAAIIANSSHTKMLLEEVGVRPERIHVIHPGVEVMEFHASEEAKRSVRQRHSLDGAFVLLTMGRLQRRKGQDMVIQALPRILKKFPNVKYLIVGTGEELVTLQQLAKDLQVWNSVVFVGQVADDERAAYYAVCDIFVMPNRQVDADIEGFGMVFLEAGAAGKPVIGGRSGGTGEAIKEGVTGLRVNGGSVEEIDEAVTFLLQDREKARAMGRCGQQWVRTEFTWESIVERTRQIALALV